MDHYKMEFCEQTLVNCNSNVTSVLNSDHKNLFKYEQEEFDEEEDITCQRTREEIGKLLGLHLRPKAIMKILSEKSDVVLPTTQQLLCYMNKLLSAKVFGEHEYQKNEISLGDLGQWLGEHSKVPKHEHTPFVICYSLNWGTFPSFCFAITSKYLLKFIVRAKHLVADPTKKLTWQGHSVLTIGTTSKNNIFYPFCLAVTTNESREHFKMIFENLKGSVLSFYSHSMNPSEIVCDGSKNIQEALREVFGSEPVIKVCWEHAKQEIENQVEKLVNRRYRKTLLNDIYLLHCATWPELFQTGLEAFLIKYRDQTDFLAYFKQEWVNKNQNWYLGVTSIKTKSTTMNKALSDFIDQIKNSRVIAEKLPLSGFLQVAFPLVKEWSQTKTLESFASSPTIDLKDWAAATKTMKNITSLAVLSDSNFFNATYYMCLDPLQVKQETSGDPFDLYEEKLDSLVNDIAVIKMPTQAEKWMEATCTCPDYFRYWKCKHIIALALRLQYVAIPPGIKRYIIDEERTIETAMIVL